MSSPTSAIQLLGGLLSLSPGANAAMPLEGAPPAMAVSGDSGGFYSLWMGMAAQGAMSSSAGAAMRQQPVMNSAGNGTELPPASAEQLLQKLDQLLQQAGDDETDLLESAVELLRLGLQQTAPDESVVSGDPGGLTESDLSDAELLDYLKSLLDPASAPNTAARLNSPAEDPLPLSSSAKQTLISYLEQKLEAPAASSASSALPVLPELLSSEEMLEAERLVRQLRAELETARQERVELQAETASSEDKAKAAEVAYAAKAAAEQAQTTMTPSGRSAEPVGLSGAESTAENKAGVLAEAGKAGAGDDSGQQVAPLAQTTQPLAAERQAADAGDKVDRMALPPERPATLQREIEKERERRAESAAAAQREPYMPNRPVGELPRTERVMGQADVVLPEGRMTSGEQMLSDKLRAAVSEERSTTVSARTETSNTQFAEAQRMAMPGNQAAQAQAPIAQAQNTQDALMQKMLNPAWSKALGERAIMMAQQGPRVAEVRLDPPELGALRIRVQIHGSDQVSLSFNAPNAAVREVLEQSMPRLREMFAEQGLNLTDASVGDQSTQERADKEQREAAAKGFAGGVGDDLGDAPAARAGARKIGLIDYYA